MMKLLTYPDKKDWPELLKRPAGDTNQLNAVVGRVFNDIKVSGDAALQKYTLRFDSVEIEHLQVSVSEFAAAEAAMPRELIDAIDIAKANITKFHAYEVEDSWMIETSKGVICWQKHVPIPKVGLYIPGGTAPLFSTVLMLGIPARLAGCKEIVLCTPPGKDGKIHPAILHTAQKAGISKVFKVGGIQAIGALAFGTESIPKVDKIFGPGNQYVTAAKQMANAEGIAIDLPAGPSEVLVVGDETAIPEFVAADLLSQAEHGTDSQVIFVSWDESLIPKVQRSLEQQLENLPRKKIAAQSLALGSLILVRNREEAVELINTYAPEHLILSVKDENYFMERVENAGSVFLGNFTPESAGDYASGTNHTLPTNGAARAYSGVSLDSFMKRITYQRISKEGIRELGPVIEVMAAAEELDAHKRAVSVRLNYLKKENV